MQPQDIQNHIFQGAEKLGWKIATAESCTGGMIATRLTDPTGASASVAGGIVTYSPAMKTNLLGVTEACLKAHGAVSDETVTAMAKGCLARTQAQLVLSVSGFAGPAGGAAEKPVGTVYFAVLSVADEAPETTKVIFDGNRSDVREQATDFALKLLADKIAAVLAESHGDK